MKTFLKYPGGKTKEIPLVCRCMPKQIDRYFEPQSFATAKGLNVDTSISSASKRKDVFIWWIPFLIILNVLAFIGTVDWFISIFFPQLYKKKEDVT